MSKIDFNKKLFSRVGSGAVAVMLALGMTPSAAFAETGDIASDVAVKILANINSSGDTDYVGEASLQSDFSLTTFDLRHVGGDTTYDATKKHSVMTGGRNYVTSIKNQSPWGDCWAFAAIAASETSLLTSSGQTYEEALANGSSFADLSERHLTWFAKQYIEEDGPYSSQAGEGSHLVATPDSLSKRDLAIFNTGGQVFLATSIFSNGTGPVPESVAPYRNNDGSTVDNGDGTSSYAMTGDWSVDSSLRFGTVAELTESRILPDSKNGNIAGVSAIKAELMAGHAVSVTFSADTSVPGATSATSTSRYINTDTWAHYTWNPKAAVNHGVTIVGWDDSYSKDNFLQGTTTVDGVEYDMTPQGDGAWIVKNNWGASSQEFPNQSNWGEDGYFYISYYDQSISGAETFVYDTSEEASLRSEFILDQYDLSGSSEINNDSYDTEVSQANVFPNDEGKQVRLRDIGYITGTARDSVNLKVYVMDKSADAADYIANNEPDAEIDQFAEFKGYNRVALTTPLSIGADQKYAIVQTTKQVSGKYELCYLSAIGKNLTAKFNEIIDAACEVQGKALYDFMAQQSPEKFAKMTDEEKAAFLKSSIELLKSRSERSTYTQAVVNEGESLFFANGTWEDWSEKIVDINAAMTKDIYDNGISAANIPAGSTIEDPAAIDNFSIKGYLDDSEPVYRLYNETTSEHLWTTDEHEYETLVDNGWTQEGQAWRSAFEGTPVYRLYNPVLGTHMYTSSAHEIHELVSKYGWVRDNEAADGSQTPIFYGSEESDSTVAVNRLYNGGLSQHMLALDKESDALKSYGWNLEGVAFYAMK